MDIKAKILEVLNKGYLMSLATLDDGGVWVADVIYTSDNDLNIYWMSYPKVRHSQAIVQNAQVAGTITITSYGEKPELALQFSGRAEKLDTIKYDLVVKYCAKIGGPKPSEDEDVLGGHSWYVLRPTKIELIDAERYGFKKQKLEL